MNISISRYLRMHAFRIEVVLLTLALSGSAVDVVGQSWEVDFAHVERRATHHAERRASRWLSAQIQAPEFFETSNREFGKDAIREWGLLKGTFLFVDRVSRSNRLYATQVYPARVNAANRIRDLAADYTLRAR